jgi:hypothetical protein
MEYLKVIVPGKKRGSVKVLINRKPNGRIGEILTLSKGIMLVSVDIPDAEETQVDLRDTTMSHPKIVEVRA